MQCPKCGSKMEKGVVFAQKSSGIHWVPSEENIPHVLSNHKIMSCGGEVMVPITYLGIKPPTAPAWICRCCKIVNIEYI